VSANPNDQANEVDRRLATMQQLLVVLPLPPRQQESLEKGGQ
jgi:hypothetical protein